VKGKGEGDCPGPTWGIDRVINRHGKCRATTFATFRLIAGMKTSVEQGI